MWPFKNSINSTKKYFFETYDYARIYLLFGVGITLILSYHVFNSNLLIFNLEIQIGLSILYFLGFLISFFSKYFKEHLFKYVFFLITLSAASTSFILYDNHFSEYSYFVFLIVMICVIFTINTINNFIFFFTLFSIFFFTVILKVDLIIVGFTTIFATYLILILTSFFITTYRVNNKTKGRAKTQLFNFLFRNSSDYLILCLKKGELIEIKDISQSALTYLGLTQEDLLGSELKEIQYLGNKLFSGFKFNRDSEKIHVNLINQSYLEIEYNTYLINNDEYLFFSITDISVNKLTEINSQVSIESYKYLFEYSSEYICIQDIDGNLIDYNSSLAAKLGCSKDEYKGKSVSIFSHDEDNKWRLQQNRKVWETNSVIKFFKEVKDVNNQIIPLEVILRKGKYFGKDVLISTSRDISERLRAENELRNSERDLNEIYENSPVIMYSENEYGIIEKVNYKFLEVFGFSKEEVVGTPFHKLLEEKFHEAYKLDRTLFWKNGVVKDAEYIIDTKNGTKLNILIDSKLINYNESKSKLCLSVIRDVTEQYKYQLQLANSVERFYKLFENAPIAMCITSYEGNFLDFNKSFIKLFGYSEEELKNMNVTKIIHPDDWEIDERIVCQMNENKYETFTTEKKYIRKDGSIIHTILNIIPDIGSSDDKPLSISQIVDITEIENYNEVLKQKQEILDLTLEASKTILWDIDLATGDAVWKNIESITGIKGEEIIVDRAQFKQFIYPDDYDYVKKSISFVTDNKEPYTIDFRLVSDKGELKWVNAKGQVKLDENGIPTNIYGTLQDITEKKEYENALEKSEEKFRQLYERNLSGVYRSSLTGQVLDCNPAFAKILGYSSVEEVLSEGNALNFYSKQQDRIGFIEEILEKKSVKSKRIELKTKDGNVIYILISSSVIYNDDNDVKFIEGNIIDITELVEAEKNLQVSKEQYKNLIDNSNYGITIIHEKKIQFINGKGIEILKYESAFELLYKPIEDFIPEGEMLIYQDIKFVKEGNSLGVQERKIIDRKGKTIDIELRANIINYNEKECVLFTFIDITTKKQIEEEKKRAELAESANLLLKEEIQERIKIENQLTLSQSYTAGIIESSIDMIYTAGINGYINEFNLAARKQFNYDKNEVLGHSMNELFADQKECNLVFSILENEGQFVGEVKSIRKDRSIFISYLSISYLYNTQGIVMGIMAVGRDITDIKEAEEILRRSEEKNKLQAAKLNTIIESSSHYFFMINKSYQLISFNENYVNDIELFYNQHIKFGKDFFESSNISDKKVKEKWINYFKVGFSGDHFHFEIEQIDQLNTKHYREVFINPIIKDDGSVDELSCIAHDITEKKVAEKSLKESLTEKEILLKEVHHRVKNNMQVISSILNLQSAYVTDPGTLQILKESQNRIKSMAFIHESLYTNKDFSKIDFSDYISNLVRNLFRTYDVFDDTIKLELNIEKIYLNLDLAIPCGLIMNELISNSLKYAFDIHKGGIIKIMLTLENEFVKLEVGDDGIGIDEAIDIENTQTLGLQLISSLVEQLEGELDLDRSNGTKFTIKFKKDN
jgi:PAS domain S-box-containing protein